MADTENTTRHFDAVVIGGGPGGYVFAIRAAQLGLKVAIVEKRSGVSNLEVALGGTCLNVGCIPSKALLHSSELYEQACHDFASHGIKTGDVSLDLEQMMARKDKVVSQFRTGLNGLMKKNRIQVFFGNGAIESQGQVRIEMSGQETVLLEAQAIVIATGSEPTTPPFAEIDEERIVSSTGALSLQGIPKTMAVIGGGVIGLELGSVWNRLGADVTIIEYMDTILAGMDGDLCREATKLFKRQGLKMAVSRKVTEVVRKGRGVQVTHASRDNDDNDTQQQDNFDICLIATGRRPNTEGLNLKAVGVETDTAGRIVVRDNFVTSCSGIYAIGDVIAGPMLAHKAEEDGVALAETLVGGAGHIDYGLVPGVVYTQPEVASVGATEASLKDQGVSYKVGKFSFQANSRAIAMGQGSGFAKLIADATSDRLLGAHIIGPQAGELIHEAATLMAFGGAAEDMGRICHAHPTLSEVVKEAALAVDGRMIHG